MGGLLVLLLWPGAAAAVRRPPSPTGVGCDACLIEEVGGRVLWSRGPHDELPNASTTKMVTALVVVRNLRMNAPVTVSAAAASLGASGGVDLHTGDVYLTRDLLYALLLSSSNEAAVAFAERVGGDQAGFVHRMNVVAGALGATHTHFVNPHGLDASGHYSSPADLALFAQAVLRQPLLKAIVASSVATIDTPVGPQAIENRNPLLETYEGAIGVKTGQTSGAGDVLVAAARRDGRTLVAVAMHSGDAASDARALLDYGFSIPEVEPEPAPPPEPEIVLAADEPVGSLVFDPAGSTGVVASSGIEAVVAGGDHPEVFFEPADSLQLPLSSGEKVGTVEVRIDNETIGSVDAIATQPVSVPGRESLALRLVTGLLQAAAIVVAGVRG